MKGLKRVGFFKELDYADKSSDHESLLLSIQKHGEYDIPVIVSYLKRGEVVSISPRVTVDVLSKDIKIGALCLLTDGIWMWPSDLVYYVEKYMISLPKEFTEYIKNMD